MPRLGSLFTPAGAAPSFLDLQQLHPSKREGRGQQQQQQGGSAGVPSGQVLSLGLMLLFTQPAEQVTLGSGSEWTVFVEWDGASFVPSLLPIHFLVATSTPATVFHLSVANKLLLRRVSQPSVGEEQMQAQPTASPAESCNSASHLKQKGRIEAFPTRLEQSRSFIARLHAGQNTAPRKRAMQLPRRRAEKHSERGKCGSSCLWQGESNYPSSP